MFARTAPPAGHLLSRLSGSPRVVPDLLRIFRTHPRKVLLQGVSLEGHGNSLKRSLSHFFCLILNNMVRDAFV